jgi:hypothetical protein
MGGQQDGEPVLGDGGHQDPHEVPAGDRVEVGERFVQDQQRRPFGQCQGQRDLGLLAARQVTRPPLQRNGQLLQPPLGQSLIPAQVEGAAHPEQVGDREVPVQRVLLGDESDSGQRLRRAGAGVLTEDLDGSLNGPKKAGDQLQQRGLTGPVRADQSDHRSGR